MSSPIDGTPASRAPRLPASMIPGPPPVMIENPAQPSLDPPQPRRVVELRDDRGRVRLQELLIGRHRRTRMRPPELLLVGLGPTVAGDDLLVLGLVHASRVVGPDSWTIARGAVAP